MAELRKGWWDTGAALGTAALGIQVLGGGNNGCGGGLLGNILGGGNNNCVQQENCTLKAMLAKEQSERYADGIGIETYKEAVALSNANDAKIQANYKEIAGEIVNIKIREAETATKLSCFQSSVEREFGAVRQEFTGAIRSTYQDLDAKIALEAERRCCGDSNIYNYVNGTFVPGTLNLYAGKVCPMPELAKNPTATPCCEPQPLRNPTNCNR